MSRTKGSGSSAPHNLKHEKEIVFMEREERVKPIVLTVDGREYTLEFSRESVRFAESRGFDLDDLARFPMTKTYEFFFYAFRMHHKGLPRDKTDQIIDEGFGGVGGIPEGVLERLGKLYAEPFNVHNDDGEDGKKLKVSVEM